MVSSGSFVLLLSCVLKKEVVYKRKESFFSLEESEFRQPDVLTLQIWDYDRISANDFLGETRPTKRGEGKMFCVMCIHKKKLYI